MKGKSNQTSEKKSQKTVSKASKRLAQCHAVVIGAGAIGRAVAILLASLGVRHMSLYDPAFVTRKNLAQGFMDFDIGSAKVEAVANIAHQQNPHMELLTYRSQFRQPHLQKWRPGLNNAVFLCVDSMTARKSICNLIKHAAQFICDGRLGPDVIRVLARERPLIDTYYPSTFLASKRPLVGKSTCDLVSATIAAGFMVAQFSRWLCDLHIIPDQEINLLAQKVIALEARN